MSRADQLNFATLLTLLVHLVKEEGQEHDRDALRPTIFHPSRVANLEIEQKVTADLGGIVLKGQYDVFDPVDNMVVDWKTKRDLQHVHPPAQSARMSSSPSTNSESESEAPNFPSGKYGVACERPVSEDVTAYYDVDVELPVGTPTTPIETQAAETIADAVGSFSADKLVRFGVSLLRYPSKQNSYNV